MDECKYQMSNLYINIKMSTRRTTIDTNSLLKTANLEKKKNLDLLLTDRSSRNNDELRVVFDSTNDIL